MTRMSFEKGKRDRNIEIGDENRVLPVLHEQRKRFVRQGSFCVNAKRHDELNLVQTFQAIAPSHSLAKWGGSPTASPAVLLVLFQGTGGNRHFDKAISAPG